jgi:tetratricopeptide (TPR) repeat protein
MIPANSISKNNWIIPGIIFTVAATVRFFYWTELPNNPLFDYFPISLDHFNFDKAALSFASGDLLAQAPNNSFAPLYKYFLGTLYWLFGRDLQAIYAVQFAMGSLGCVLIYYVGKEAFGVRAGIISGLLLALYAPHIVYEGIILRAAFISFWGIVSLFFLLRLRKSYSINNLVVATLTVSLFFQGRPNTMICLPFISIYLSRNIFSKLPDDQRKKNWFIFLGVLLGSFIPLLIQCYLVHGKFVFFDASGPHTFISGNLIGYSGVGFEHQLVENYRKKQLLGYLSNIQFLFGHIIDSPLDFILLYVRKLFFFINDFEPPTNISFYSYQSFSKTLPLLVNHFGIISSLGLIGALLAWKKRKSDFLLFSYLGALSIAIILFLNEARYRIPVVPIFIVFSGYTLAQLIEYFSYKKFAPIITIVATAIVLWFVVLEPKNMIRIRSNDFGNLGEAFLNKGNLDASQTAFLNSARQAPNNVYSRINLGRIYALKGQREAAVEQLLYSIKINPNLWQPYANLGTIYAESGIYNKAEDFLLKANKLNPQSADILFRIGDMYSRMYRHKDSIKFLSKSLTIYPNNLKSLNLIGIEFELVGLRKDALISLEKSVNLNPKDYKILNNLGVLYQKSGMLQKAALAFNKSITSNPQFIEAQKNLKVVEQILTPNPS